MIAKPGRHNILFRSNVVVSIAFCWLVTLTFSSIATAQNPVSLINQPLVPDATKPGGAGFTLTVNGTGFVSGSVVHWNGNARTTTFVSSSKLTATIAASDIATAKTAPVTVVSPGPGGGTSNVIFFDVTPSSTAFGFEATNTGTYSGIFPTSVAVGDFNRDGKLDLAVANLVTNNVSVLLGKGDGTFEAPVDYGIGGGSNCCDTSRVAVGDFNGDGRLDLAVANYSDDNVSVLLGNGDGTFQKAANYSTGLGPWSVTLGDFNGDGKLDLAVANANGNNVSVLLGNGDGTFQAAASYGAGVGPAAIATGDFNRDGRLDLVVANADGASNNVSVLLGNGDGTFQSAVDYSTGSSPRSLAVGDFNGDGNLDLAVANYSDDNVSVLLGNGDGTFQKAENYSTGLGPSSVTLGDFNGDGKLDLVTANNNDNSLSILFGNGDGSFQGHLDYGGIRIPETVALGDFNGDGRLDMAVPTTVPAGEVGILLQAPIVTLSPTSLTFRDQLIGTNSTPQDVTLFNTSGLTLNNASIVITGTNARDFSQTRTCGSTIPPGGHCTISVTFSPSQVGSKTASITINGTGSALGSPQSIALTGVGVVTGPNATLSTTSLSISCRKGCLRPTNCFCFCNSSPPGPITLADFGKADLSITGIGTTSPFTQSNTCGGSLKSGNTCTISVGLGHHTSGTGTLRINDNAPGSPQVVNLTGSNSCP